MEQEQQGACDRPDAGHVIPSSRARDKHDRAGVDASDAFHAGA
jgi:hypothetical protein